jgi:hypothetical protein
MEGTPAVPMNGHAPVPAKRTTELLARERRSRASKRTSPTRAPQPSHGCEPGQPRSKPTTATWRAKLTAQLRGSAVVSSGDTLSELPSWPTSASGSTPKRPSSARTVSSAPCSIACRHQSSTTRSWSRPNACANSVLHTRVVARQHAGLQSDTPLSRTMVRREVEDPRPREAKSASPHVRRTSSAAAASSGTTSLDGTLPSAYPGVERTPLPCATRLGLLGLKLRALELAQERLRGKTCAAAL